MMSPKRERQAPETRERERAGWNTRGTSAHRISLARGTTPTTKRREEPSPARAHSPLPVAIALPSPSDPRRALAPNPRAAAGEDRAPPFPHSPSRTEPSARAREMGRVE
ncbi:hypothetical protein SEVIR_3G392750v4 [Setaria viridis]